MTVACDGDLDGEFDGSVFRDDEVNEEVDREVDGSVFHDGEFDGEVDASAFHDGEFDGEVDGQVDGPSKCLSRCPSQPKKNVWINRPYFVQNNSYFINKTNLFCRDGHLDGHFEGPSTSPPNSPS